MRHRRLAVKFAAAKRHRRLLTMNDVGTWDPLLAGFRWKEAAIHYSSCSVHGFQTPTSYAFQAELKVLYITRHPGVFLGHQNYRSCMGSLTDYTNKRFIGHKCKNVPEQTVDKVHVAFVLLHSGICSKWVKLSHQTAVFSQPCRGLGFHKHSPYTFHIFLHLEHTGVFLFTTRLINPSSVQLALRQAKTKSSLCETMHGWIPSIIPLRF